MSINDTINEVKNLITPIEEEIITIESDIINSATRFINVTNSVSEEIVRLDSSFGNIIFGNAINALRTGFLTSLMVGTQVSLPFLTGHTTVILNSPFKEGSAQIEGIKHNINPMIPISSFAIDLAYNCYQTNVLNVDKKYISHHRNEIISKSFIDASIAIVSSFIAYKKPEVATSLVVFVMAAEGIFAGKDSPIDHLKDTITYSLDVLGEYLMPIHE